MARPQPIAPRSSIASAHGSARLHDREGLLAEAKAKHQEAHNAVLTWRQHESALRPQVADLD
jgi:hypothetical protein